MSEQSFWQAFAAAQAKLENPPKTKTAKAGSYSYKYADIADILNHARPILAEHGLTLSQTTFIDGDMLALKTTVTRGGDDAISGVYPVCTISADHQKMGAAMTYARRYALSALLGIAAEDDLDGQGAATVSTTRPQKMTAAQAKREINWDAVEESIENANSIDRLNKIADRIQSNQGHWPDSFISAAFDKIEARREALFAEQFPSAAE